MPTPQPAISAAPPHSTRLHGLAPVVGPGTVVLILGSFPGVASLRAGQYYAHAQNHFWPILQSLWPAHPLPEDYASRCAWLLERGLGLWDVYASCERQGSLDAAIRAPLLNDFAALTRQCPRLAAVAHNGAESYRHAPQVQAALAVARPGAAPVALAKLPSTSPANASWSRERKRSAWAVLMQEHGLL